MGYNNVPNHDEDDDVVPESDVEEDDVQEHHDYENTDNRQHAPRIVHIICNSWPSRPPPQELMYYSNMTPPPGHMYRGGFGFDAAAHPQLPYQPSYQPPYQPPLHHRYMRPPPNGVPIPNMRWPHKPSPQGRHSIPLCRVHHPSLYNNQVQYHQLSGRRRQLCQIISSPMMPQHQCHIMPHSLQVCTCRQSPWCRYRGPRSPSTTPPRSIYNRNSITNGGYYHPRGGRSQRSAMAVTRRRTLYSIKRKSRRSHIYNNCYQKNRVDLDVMLDNPQQEEEEDDDLEDPRNVCEAYKDLHCDDSSDDDSSNNNAPPANMTILF